MQVIVFRPPQVDIEIGVGGIIEDKSQSNPFLGGRQLVQRPARLVSESARDDLAVDDQLDAHQFIDLKDKAPDAPVRRHSDLPGTQIEADPRAASSRRQQRLWIDLQHQCQAAPDPPDLVQPPRKHAAEECQSCAHKRQQRQKPGNVVHGPEATRFR